MPRTEPKGKAGTPSTVAHSTAPWSILHNTLGGYGKVSTSQGQSQAEGWAYALLQQLGVKRPTAPQVQFVYDWELSEGGGGFDNPLNVGHDPAHPSWSGGSQFGGGAAAYTSLHNGLLATADYLHMPNFRSITAALTGGDTAGARAALIKSPWAGSHYGGGKGLSTAPLPKGVKVTSQGFASDPSTLMPGGLRGVIDDVGSGANSAGGAIATGAGDVASGIGSGLGGFLKNPIVIVVAVVLLIVLLKR